MKFRPALLMGLGDYGSEIARRMGTRIRAAHESTAPLVGLLELHDDGKIVDGFGGNAYGEIALGDSATYPARFAALAAAEDTIEKAIVASLGQLRRLETRLPLREQGLDVTAETALYFIAPLGDDLGSPALIAFLELVRRLLEGRLVGEKLHRTVLCFFPDLFPDQRDVEERYARSFICLQELELIASPWSFRDVYPFDYISLFTARNEVNEDLGSYENVAEVLGDVFDLALRGEIKLDESYTVVLANSKLGYSSMGMAKLVFPREAICRALDARFAGDVLEDYGVLEENLYDRHLVSTDVRMFVFDNGLDRIEPRMRLDAAGKPIWRDFTTRASFSEDASVEETLATLREDADQYQRFDVSSMTAKIRETRLRLGQEHTERLTQAVSGWIDSKGTRYAHAFLDVLLNETSDYTTGDIVDNPVSADNIDQGARGFFDELFRIPRETLSKLQQEINSKKAVLAQHLASQTAAASNEDPELTAAIGKRQAELEKLQKQHAEILHQVKTHDLQLQDGAQRRQLLERHRSEVAAQVRQQAATVEPLDADYRAKAVHLTHVRALYNERKRVLSIFLASATLIAVVALVAIWRTGFVQDYRIQVSTAVAGLLSAFGIWVFIEWRRAKGAVKTAHAAVRRAALQKQHALLALKTLYEKMFEVTRDFTVHGAAMDWATDVKEAFKNLRRVVAEFRTTSRELYDQEKAVGSEPLFPSSLLTRNVASLEDVDRLHSLADRYPHERTRVRADHPLSMLFESFRARGDLEVWISALRNSSAEVFATLRTMSIETFLGSGENAKRTTTERVGQLFHFGMPLIQLRIEGSDDSLRNKTFFGASSGEQSPLLDVARRLGREPSPFRASNDTEIVLVTTKVGFPASHIALISHCDRALQDSKNPAALRAVPEWRLPALIPSSIELGTEDDPARQLACQSLALGVVVENEQGLVFEQQVIGRNYRSFVELLRSLRGAGLTARLQVRAAEAMKQDNVENILANYLDQKKGDDIDRRIIQSLLERLED